MRPRAHSPGSSSWAVARPGDIWPTRLEQELGGAGHARITLVDRSLTHLRKPMLHTMAADIRDVHQHKMSLLRMHAAMGLSTNPARPAP